MADFLRSIFAWFEATQVPQQIKEVDYQGLFTNPWFLVPFVAVVVYLLYRQAFRDLVILGIFVGGWWFSGLDYMQTVVVDGHLQMNKVLPLLFGGACVLALLIYMLFGRSD